MVYDDARESDVTSLEKLAAELAPRGFDTYLTTPEGRLPFLTVRNQEAAQLTEMILADGGSFWWSWAERIAKIDDPRARRRRRGPDRHDVIAAHHDGNAVLERRAGRVEQHRSHRHRPL